MYADWAPPRAVRGFWVFAAGGGAVMDIEARPGNLISVAAPSGPLATHPWLHAISRNPMHEHALRQILLASADFDDFTARLVAAGYDLLGNGAELFDIEGGARRIQRGATVVGALFEGIGHPSTLRWQPEDGALLEGPAVVTAYVDAHAEALLGAVRGAASFDDAVSKLALADYSVG